jgi:hypothetical protein
MDSLYEMVTNTEKAAFIEYGTDVISLTWG